MLPTLAQAKASALVLLPGLAALLALDTVATRCGTLHGTPLAARDHAGPPQIVEALRNATDVSTMIRRAGRALVSQRANLIRQRDAWLEFTAGDTGVDSTDKPSG